MERYAYGVYGSAVIRDTHDEILNASSVGNPYFFTGRRLDTETRLYYYRARYYSPTLGRFLQTDPIGYDGGINLYTYSGNNPIVLVDPSGLCAEGGGYDYLSAFQGDWMGPGGYIRDIGQYWWGVATAPADYYDVFRDAGYGPFVAGVESAIMSAGKVVGYSTLGEGLEGVGVRDVRLLSGGEKVRTIIVGGVQTAGSVIVVAESLHIATTGGSAAWRGGEVGVKDATGKTRYRISSYGHKGRPLRQGRLPHYHRRGPGGIGEHRPWEKGRF